ncbi:hypothetical protein EWM64_g3729 [Hericium alpestre]|uniref:Gfo/Idh/MocA-like oxidoreductase N-terminal domain-containing protein n=1 Tax=Hericium alpestre TaxID=135208 RepID=A0A4Z0A0N4_9AGAM|nr:hypothetical protein EWM64_g3729 [Hericium alpestre]
MSAEKKLNVLMCGTGEYTTGWTGSGASKSDKKLSEVRCSVQVVGLTLFDLRRLGKVDKLGMVGVNGGKFPAIRQHLQENIANVYKDLDISFDAFPGENQVDPEAYKAAIDKLSPGDAVIIFTPDSTHYPIARYAIEHKLHVLVTKPATQLLSHHLDLIDLAKKNEVVCFVEHHKRDARARAATLGEFNFFNAWMSQPKSQLETFRAWAGKDSDISYYLSSHHIDICCWILQDRAVPTRVVASAATGIATSEPYNCGDINVDQAHRGYDVTVDDTGKAWYNPFYMKYSPSESGHFDGQRGYGYVSIEKFIDAARSVNAGQAQPGDFDKHGLPTIANTVLTTAILNAGRISLDEKRAVGIRKDGEQWVLE